MEQSMALVMTETIPKFVYMTHTIEMSSLHTKKIDRYKNIRVMEVFDFPDFYLTVYTRVGKKFAILTSF